MDTQEQIELLLQKLETLADNPPLCNESVAEKIKKIITWFRDEQTQGEENDSC